MTRFLWIFWLSLAELLRFGMCPWWWRLRWAVWRESRTLDVRHVSQAAASERLELSYGETPTATLARILELSGVPEGASFVDLGSGRGITVLAAGSLGYQAQGVELLGEYVELARRVARRMGARVEFRQGDIVEAPWPQAQLYLLNSTQFPEELRSRLLRRLESLSPDAVVVTYDWELESRHFEEFGCLSLPVTLGVVECRLFRRRP